ncbi:MAG: hypothetical protein MR051_05265 [Lentisphaeria bacterium]|nr:hypothetical protein [Lentisphaeria bacterium]
MKFSALRRALPLVAAVAAGLTAAEPESVRTIHLRQDDAQVRFESKVYELKHVTAEDILPFVNSAILRYSRNSTIRSVSAENGGREAILVSTGREFLPRVDAIVAALDRPGRIKDGDSPIQGTGVAKVAFSPRYRAAGDLSRIIDKTIGSNVGNAYVNAETNTIFWRDQTAAAKRTLNWVRRLDRPLPQVRVRINYYELRDSDLKDWGMDYLAWKNGPGVNLLNVGYNAGRIAIDELLQDAAFAATSTWGFGGFFTAPQFDMSFIRCLQQSGNANAAASASLVMVNTPVANEKELKLLRKVQDRFPDTAPFIHRISMEPEYQNIAKNTLGRTFVGKSFYEDDDGNLYSDPPSLEVKIVNPFVCHQISGKEEDAVGFIPETPEFFRAKNELAANGGVIFDYSLYFKSVVERGNTGSELSNSALFSGAATLGFGREKVLTVYEKENEVEQTIGLPILSRIPLIKYLFSTVTTIKERTYIIVTAEAEMVHPDLSAPAPVSQSAAIERRPEQVLRHKQHRMDKQK